jgi:hypothetical protein
LPLSDVVWANEKAWFQTPYTTFGQSPDGCSTVMFPKIMGGPSVSTVFVVVVLDNILKKSGWFCIIYIACHCMGTLYQIHLEFRVWFVGLRIMICCASFPREQPCS